jgi:hypothetical protein
VLLASSVGANGEPVPQTLITNVQIFDGVSDKLTPGNVLVEANLIKEIADSISAPFVASSRFYVNAHNEVMPHSAFEGQTPDEVFFGIGHEVTKKLAEARKTAREERMKENRAAGCGVCIGDTESRALLLQRPRSRMS